MTRIDSTATRIVSTTSCYPRAVRPTRGIFVERRLRELHRLMPLWVVAPEPWFPWVRGAGLGAAEAFERESSRDGPVVVRPRMFYFPGVMKRWDAGFYARALEPVLREMGDVGLVDAHFEWPDGVGAWRAARRVGAKFVCTLRGKLVSQIREPVKRRMIREMLLDADGLIAVSRSLADLAREVAGRELGVEVIPNGVDGKVFRTPVSREAAREALGWSRDARYVVSVGHLQALKGFDRLVEVWGEVRRRARDARLVLVGGSAGEAGYERRLRGTARAACEAAGDDMAVTLVGRRTQGEIAAMLGAADLFALASRSEGWCNAIGEALACGCPVVATDVGGNGEIVYSAELGRLVGVDDRMGLVEAIVDKLERNWDREEIARIGGGRSWGQVGRECAEVLGGILDDESRMRRGGGRAEFSRGAAAIGAAEEVGV